jgi:cytochrome b561
MIFGIPVSGPVMLIGGGVMFLLVAFQVLAGLRIIKLGKVHRVVHRWTAFVIIALAVVHGVLGLLFATGLSIF